MGFIGSVAGRRAKKAMARAHAVKKAMAKAHRARRVAARVGGRR